MMKMSLCMMLRQEPTSPHSPLENPELTEDSEHYEGSIDILSRGGGR